MLNSDQLNIINLEALSNSVQAFLDAVHWINVYDMDDGDRGTLENALYRLKADYEDLFPPPATEEE